MTRETFMGHLLMLAEATRKELSPMLMRLWQDKYADLPDPILLAAFSEALDTCRFFPSPAEFNDYISTARRAAGEPGMTRPEEESAALLKKISRYNPDLGIVNDGTRGLIIARAPGRQEDQDGSGFTARELRVLRIFGGATRVAAWDDKDRQFNRPRLIEAFGTVQADEAAEDRLLRIQSTSVGTPPRLGGGR